MMDFITEDSLINYLNSNNAILITRKICNIDNVIFDNIDREVFVGLTAYDHILKMFNDKYLSKFKFPIKLVLLESDEYKLPIDFVNNPIIKKYMDGIYHMNMKKLFVYL